MSQDSWQHNKVPSSSPFPIHLQPQTHLTISLRPNTAFPKPTTWLKCTTYPQQHKPSSLPTKSNRICPQKKLWILCTRPKALVWILSIPQKTRHLTCIQCMAAQHQLWEHGYWWAFIWYCLLEPKRGLQSSMVGFLKHHQFIEVMQRASREIFGP